MEGGELSILKIILDSGLVVKLVLLMLIAASIASWAIILAKRRELVAIKKNNKEFLDRYNEVESLGEMVDICSTLPFSTYKLMFVEGYEEIEKIRSSLGDTSVDGGKVKVHLEKYGMEAIKRALKKGHNEASTKMDEMLSILASIGSVTPFIGLFGTVWGIIDSFTGLATGGGTLDAVAPGIAEALVATAVGLAAAIPAVWFYNHYNSIASTISSDMDSFGQEFLNVVERSFT